MAAILPRCRSLDGVAPQTRCGQACESWDIVGSSLGGSMRRALTMLAFTTFTALGTLPATAGGTTTISISIDCPGCKVSAVNAKSYYRSDGREDASNAGRTFARVDLC